MKPGPRWRERRIAVDVLESLLREVQRVSRHCRTKGRRQGMDLAICIIQRHIALEEMPTKKRLDPSDPLTWLVDPEPK